MCLLKLRVGVSRELLRDHAYAAVIGERPSVSNANRAHKRNVHRVMIVANVRLPKFACRKNVNDGTLRVRELPERPFQIRLALVRLHCVRLVGLTKQSSAAASGRAGGCALKGSNHLKTG